MSAVLEARISSRLAEILANPGDLSVDEMAAELLNAALPLTDEVEWYEPIWWALLQDSSVCTNCLCTDCACCIGCGSTDADIVGSHGYWCAL